MKNNGSISSQPRVSAPNSPWNDAIELAAKKAYSWCVNNGCPAYAEDISTSIASLKKGCA